MSGRSYASSEVSSTDARPRWSSWLAFVVASIGSSTGFGPIWRFPQRCFQYGGGAFFIPYLFAICVFGIPIFILELAMGQYFQAGNVGLFGSINKRTRGFGLASVMCAFVVNCYYTNLIGWCIVMFFRSATGNAGWRDIGESEAFKWFLDTVLSTSTVQEKSLFPTRLVLMNVAALAFIWLAIFFFLAFGVKWAGRLSYITTGLSVFLLGVLVIRTSLLPGATGGLKAYAGEWDMSVLSERPEVWSTATSQVFFSLGLASGVMTAYGSYSPQNSPVFKNSLIIASGNTVFSLMAGLAVFSTVGFIANQESVAVEDLSGLGGPGLLFGTLPVALSRLEHGAHWERFLFFVLFLLGIDSSFSICQAVVTAVKDTTVFARVERSIVTGLVCAASFACSLLFATDAGFYFIDVVDFYLNFTLLLVGIFETLAVGWVFDFHGQAERLGFAPVLAVTGTALIPITVASIVWFGISTTGIGSIAWGFLALLVLTAAGMGATVCLGKKAIASGKGKSLSGREYWTELLMGNMLLLRRRLDGVGIAIPFAWYVLVKYVVPQGLIVLFANLSSSTDAKSGTRKFGGYGGFSLGYQAVGIGIFALCGLVMLIGIVAPSLFSCFIAPAVLDRPAAQTALDKVEDGDLEDASSTAESSSEPSFEVVV